MQQRIGSHRDPAGVREQRFQIASSPSPAFIARPSSGQAEANASVKSRLDPPTRTTASSGGAAAGG